jgi:pyroglutamyl-peptidase
MPHDLLINQPTLGELRILVTGFDPFGGASWNPSGDITRSLHGQTIAGATIVGRILPVVWNAAPRLLGQYLEEVRPHIAISLGMALDCLEIETQATNRRRSDRRDNDGVLPIPPRDIATTSLPTALPVDAIVNALADDGGIQVSDDAGGFLCEEVFFALMSAHAEMQAAARWPFRRAGFIHVPNDRFVANDIERAQLERRIVRIIEATIADVSS